MKPSIYYVQQDLKKTQASKVTPVSMLGRFTVSPLGTGC